MALHPALKLQRDALNLSKPIQLHHGGYPTKSETHTTCNEHGFDGRIKISGLYLGVGARISQKGKEVSPRRKWSEPDQNVILILVGILSLAF